MLTFETHDPNHNAETNPIKDKKKKNNKEKFSTKKIQGIKLKKKENAIKKALKK
jgi:hypothetical protein